jgi:uncharacterized membrane protein YbhN (UPF0104 family)
VKLRLAAILLGLVAIGALAFFLDAEPLRRAAGYAYEHPWSVLAACAAYTAAFALRAGAWRQLVRKEVSSKRLFAIVMGALFLNHAAPAKAGDFARMYALSQLGVRGERAVASVVLARYADLAGLLVVLLPAWLLAGGGGWRSVAPPALAVLGVTLALPLLVRVGLPGAGRVACYARRLQAALRETGRGALLRALLLAAPAWVLEAGILLVVARGVGLELSAAEVVAASCFAVLVAAVPLAPGSLGTYEAGMVAALVVFGVAAPVALAAAVLTHAMKFLYAFGAAPFAASEGLAAVRNERREGEISVKV